MDQPLPWRDSARFWLLEPPSVGIIRDCDHTFAQLPYSAFSADHLLALKLETRLYHDFILFLATLGDTQSGSKVSR